MKSLAIVFIVFANYSFVPGYPLKKVVFPSGSEEIGDDFPYDNIDNVKDRYPNVNMKLRFRIDAENVPCANSSVRFCENVDQQLYPSEHVVSVLEKNADVYAEFFNKIESRDDFPEAIELCDTYKSMVSPQIAMNVNQDWRFIINHPKYKQQIRVELCQKRSKQCQFGESFPPGYVSTCTQKFVRIPLLSLDDDGGISKYEYEFPSHCQCDVHRESTTAKSKRKEQHDSRSYQISQNNV